MTAKSFFVTLPSNTFSKEYPGNKIGNYKITLPQPLNFEDNSNWEVGVAEIIYPKTWINVYGVNANVNFRYMYNNRGYIRRTKIPDGYYENAQHLINKINLLKPRRMQKENIMYIHPAHGKVEVYMPGYKYLDLHSDVLYMLGLQQTPFTNIESLMQKHKSIFQRRAFLSLITIRGGVTVAKHTPNFNKSIRTMMYIYSNVVPTQPIGNQYYPLATMFTIDNKSTFGTRIVTTFERIRYQPVSTNAFDYIHIKCVDEYGEEFIFTEGVIIVKLHFKYKQHRS